MTNPTSNFGWQMPTSTDLVTDLPADFETFGQAVDTSLADLKGGTSGQILAKASNTDMDFTWVTNDVGDITAVTAGTGISGGGTSGAVTITNDMATTITTNGDLIYGTGSGTYTRRGIGSTGQVLTVSGGVPTWATPSTGGSGFTLISNQTMSAQSSINFNSCFSSTYRNYRVLINVTSNASDPLRIRLRSGSTDATGANYSLQYLNVENTSLEGFRLSDETSIRFSPTRTSGTTFVAFDINNPFIAAPTTVLASGNDPAGISLNGIVGLHNLSNSYDGLTVFATTANLTGNVAIYGYGA